MSRWKVYRPSWSTSWWVLPAHYADGREWAFPTWREAYDFADWKARR